MTPNDPLAKHSGSSRRPLPRGLVIAAPRSGSGKTILTLGLMRAYRRAGLRIGGAKCGPDYIDPAFHTAATGERSFNLDSWAMDPNLLHQLAAAAGLGCDFVLCEGSMGLFDGVPAAFGRTGASADVAADLGWPLVLVLDVSGQAQTAAALVEGCANYDERLAIAGVVLNKVASPRHERLVTAAIEARGFAVLGALPREDDMMLVERHLGLVQAREISGLDERLDQIAAFVAAHVDLDRIRASARSGFSRAVAVKSPSPPPAGRIAVARDQAFSFLYPHILESWQAAGTEIVFFSPLADAPPPPRCDFCWLPGGYPELHAAKLAAATRFMEGLRAFARKKPVHGECGGYMVLGRSLVAANGVEHPMAGLLAPTFSFANRKLHLGYRDAVLAADHPLGVSGTALLGHEFHYATIEAGGDEDPPFAWVRDAYSKARTAAGSRRGLATGSFFHVIAAVEGSC
jgi:cobyrinic acid a,c-diamide synthase